MRALALTALGARWLPVAAAIFVLVLFVGLCKYTTAQADDFDFAVMYQRYGVLGSQRAWYLGWNGRYFFNITASLALGEMNILRFYWLVPALGFAMGATTTLFVMRALYPRLRGLALYGGAAVWLALYFLNAPAKNDTFYWLIGVLTYPIANIGLALYGVFLARMFARATPKERRQNFYLAALTAFVTVGCNETSMVLLLLLTGAAVLVALVFSRRSLVHCILLLVVACLCTAIVVLAPGNAVRSSFLPLRGQLGPTLENSWTQFKDVLEPWCTNTLLLALTAAHLRPLQLLGLRVGRAHRMLRHPLTPLVVVLFGLLGIFATIAPSWWSKGAGVIPRTLNITYFAFLCTWLAGFSLALAQMKILARTRTASRLWAILTSVFLTYALLTHPWVKSGREQLTKTGPTFLSETRLRYAAIADARAKGVTTLVVPPLKAYPPDLNVLEMSSCPTGWPNASQGEFFGLDKLSLPGHPLACPPVPQKAREVVNPYSMYEFRKRD